MDKKEYDDFVLRIIREESEGYVAIPSGPAEAATGEPFASPFGEGEIEEIRAVRGRGSRDLESPKQTVQSKVEDLGERLFKTVFSGSVGRFWFSSLDRARDARRGLRLRLILEAPDLWVWPWEALQDPNGDLLILAPDISIVRCPAA